MVLQIHTVVLLPFPSLFLSHLVILVIPVHSFQRSLALVVKLVQARQDLEILGLVEHLQQHIEPVRFVRL